ncbi:hypothetical protein DFH07DRAFT_768703 [Mycena maculata]|uniref:Uncharacterized protein n=1 Tax=Mycena maculata TaxID=230809 RepID=A0AAD7JTW5_9AGAR|nr:hypothetical protein DFH07DRAFT_768703 [Mycena maculata]
MSLLLLTLAAPSQIQRNYYSVSNIHLSLNAGKWNYERWGYLEADVRSGAELWAGMEEGGFATRALAQIKILVFTAGEYIPLRHAADRVCMVPLPRPITDALADRWCMSMLSLSLDVLAYNTIPRSKSCCEHDRSHAGIAAVNPRSVLHVRLLVAHSSANESTAPAVHDHCSCPHLPVMLYPLRSPDLPGGHPEPAQHQPRGCERTNSTGSDAPRVALMLRPSGARGEWETVHRVKCLCEKLEGRGAADLESWQSSSD